MITGTSTSKQAGSEYIDVPKYIGVASVKVMAINPNNAKLRSLGWNISENAEEPNYVTTTTLEDGTIKQSARVRFMVQLQEPEDKPIIPLDFWIRPDKWFNKDKTKCKIIDNYGRTAWGTKDEISGNKVPVYATGPAKISLPYNPCHMGQEELVQFIKSYLCCTPFESYDKKTKSWKKNENPGTLTIDDWKALCNGNAKELVGYVAMQPDNLVKVILGVQKTEDNKVYQTFIKDSYLANNAMLTNGEYPTAERIIAKVKDDGYHDNYEFSAAPVVQYSVTPTEVTPAAASTSSNIDVDALFNEPGVTTDEDDLPFEL